MMPKLAVLARRRYFGSHLVERFVEELGGRGGMDILAVLEGRDQRLVARKVGPSAVSSTWL